MHPLVNIATKAARRAGTMIYRSIDNMDKVVVEEKSPNDFVSNIDKRAEKMIIETIQEVYPEHNILAEESGAQVSESDDDTTWIIDPLDGTTNYLYGFPHYCVSIAVKQAGKIQHAVVYDPLKDEIFSASRGQGAVLNGSRIRVNATKSLKGSFIGTGTPYRVTDNIDSYMALLKDLMTQCRDIRRPGSAALDLCYVACGRYDGFFEFGLSSWDMAAGSLIIEEAGGIVDDLQGKQDYLNSGDIVAATPKLFREFVQLIRRHR
ncbi:MAG: inositol monophosphatase [Gammaproteobacteria bacterium]|nr:inositol monophosphatase [Gammaproteobacteria bacterium]NNJ72305.1 inositol monophosphatase [Enterobacterales bacterium]